MSVSAGVPVVFPAPAARVALMPPRRALECDIAASGAAPWRQGGWFGLARECAEGGAELARRDRVHNDGGAGPVTFELAGTIAARSTPAAVDLAAGIWDEDEPAMRGIPCSTNRRIERHIIGGDPKHPD